MKKPYVDKILERLEHSSMFHLSLGSKELFHSNFLYWLSIVDWNAFMQVARKLAGVKCFWWENQYKRSDDRDENEIEVRRESRNFDLSIFVCVHREAKEDGSTEAKEAWIPVFILENKMKSLPRQDQLQEYTEKAFKEWNKKKKFDQIEELWQQEGISFVLLSLFVDDEFQNQCYYTYKKKENERQVVANWKIRNYKDLHEFLKGMKLQDGNVLNLQILEDYCQFILALHDLAENDWKISVDDMFVKTIHPWAIKGYHGDRQVQLRIDDIRQKVHYAQMEKMLRKKLSEEGIEACHAKEKDKKTVMYATNYAHNIGILEISVAFQGDTFIFIQLQGNSYAHAFARLKNENAAQELIKYEQQMEPLFEFSLEGPANEKCERVTEKYPAVLMSKVLYPQGVNKQAVRNKMDLTNFKYFGQGFIYQNILIPEKVTIGEVIQAMVEDTKKIIEIREMY